MSFAKFAAIGAALAVAGCASVQPQIDPQRIGQPRTVVIARMPEMIPVAGSYFMHTHFPDHYFSGNVDGFYASSAVAAETKGDSAEINQAVINNIATSSRPISPGAGAVAGAAGALIGGIFDSVYAENQKLGATEFPTLVKKTFPGELDDELLTAMKGSLESRGIKVQVIDHTRNVPPRLYWPAAAAKDQRGGAVAAGPFATSDPVDADLLVQVSAVAAYVKSCPGCAYYPRVGLGLALYNGRTREFLGWQAFSYEQDDRHRYKFYDDLVKAVPKAGPVLRTELLALVPQAVNVISGSPK